MPSRPLGIKVLSDLDQGARVVHVAREGTEMASVYPVTGRFPDQARALPGTPWTLTVFSHMARADEAAQSYALIASTGAAFWRCLPCSTSGAATSAIAS